MALLHEVRVDPRFSRTANVVFPDTFTYEQRLGDLVIGQARVELAAGSSRVLATEVDYAVGVWAEAIDGDDAPLHAVASTAAVQELLYPGDATSSQRLVVRGVRVRSVEIVELAAREMPPAMVVQLRASGRRYIEDRTTTTVLSGDRSVESSFTLRWRMELSDDPAHPWRIAAVLDPGTRREPADAQAVQP